MRNVVTTLEREIVLAKAYRLICYTHKLKVQKEALRKKQSGEFRYYENRKKHRTCNEENTKY